MHLSFLFWRYFHLRKAGTKKKITQTLLCLLLKKFPQILVELVFALEAAPYIYKIGNQLHLHFNTLFIFLSRSFSLVLFYLLLSSIITTRGNKCSSRLDLMFWGLKSLPHWRLLPLFLVLHHQSTLQFIKKTQRVGQEVRRTDGRESLWDPYNRPRCPCKQ